MNKLWVRMQHGMRDLDKREQEREELNILVGKNLSRLSQLEGLTIGLYKSDVLPRILSQIVTCKDRIAQQYLMVILIQAFSDEFHLRTLDQLLESIHKLQEDVDICSILMSLIERLANYCVSHMSSLPTDVDVFQMFLTNIDELGKSRKTVPLSAVLSLQNSLIILVCRCYKDKPSYIDDIYASCRLVIESRSTISPDDKQSIQQVTKLLQTPAEIAKSIKPLLGLKNFRSLMDALPNHHKRNIAQYLVSENQTCISNVEEVIVLLDYLAPITQRDSDVNDEEWHDYQQLVSYAISLMYNKDPELMVPILQKVKEHFLNQSATTVGHLYTLVPLTFKALSLVQAIFKKQNEDPNCEKRIKYVFKYANEVISLVKNTDIVAAYNLYLQCTLQAAQCGLAEFTTAFLNQSLTLFEDEKMTQSKQEYNGLRYMIGVVQRVSCLDNETFQSFAMRIAQLSSKLIVVELQSRATALSTYLFTNLPERKDPKLAMSCLKKAMSASSSVVEPDVLLHLYVDLFDHYVYFFANHPDVAVEAKHLNAIIVKINKLISINNIDKSHKGLLHYRNVMNLITEKQNWQTYIKKQQKKDSPQQEVIDESGLNEKEALAEASRWKEIQI
eukprot:TRINITY_DN788_c0_g3_i1.p1 TRINITY_DN788_c0_g3~~TRINITY_DN788_c0_g3_i1.p1  ORF type:complete len:699 (-),score=122.39 TRINITY_DN788_c0_g3_i1:99-1943(-)